MQMKIRQRRGGPLRATGEKEVARNKTRTGERRGSGGGGVEKRKMEGKINVVNPLARARVLPGIKSARERRLRSSARDSVSSLKTGALPLPRWGEAP